MHRCLIDAETLTERLDDPAWAVFDCRYVLGEPDAGRRHYQALHLPGAQYLDLAADLSGVPGPGTGRHPLPDPQALAQRLGGLGIGPGTQVVVYDSGELYYAARAWWLLRWLGHEAVAVLDGGFAAWQAQGRAVTDELPWPRTAQLLAARTGTTQAVDTAQVQSALSGPGLLLDARAADRFSGASEPMDPVAGHIPGALNHPSSRNLGADGHLRPAPALAAELRALLAGRPASQVVCYCGSGVSACLNLLAMEYAGLPGARLYAGSWSAWCADPARPVERD